MNKFEKAYKIINEDITCPANCKICENDFSLFLPGEIKYLSRKLKISQNKLANRCQKEGRLVQLLKKEDKGCRFYKFGRCTKREARPLDCRSYPGVPYLKNGKISVKLDKKCPLVKNGKILKDYLKKSLRAWRFVNPPKWWLKIYKRFDNF